MTRGSELISDDMLRGAEDGGDPAALEAADQLRALSVADPARAIETARRIASRLPPGSAALPRILASCAHAQCYSNDFTGAVETLGDALGAAEALGDAGEIGTLHLTRVQPLARLGRLDEAESSALTAMRHYEATGQGFHAARSAVNLGIVLRMRGRCAEALSWFDRARDGLAHDHAATAAMESNRAEALLDLDRFEESGKAFESALARFTTLGHHHACAIVEGNLADLDSRAGRIDAAIVRFERARGLFEETGARSDSARLQAEQAEALQTVGAHRKGRRLYDQAIPVLTSAGLAREEIRAKLGLGIALLHAGDAIRALRVLSEAADAATGCGAAPLVADIHAARSAALMRMQRLDEARVEAGRSLALMGSQGVRRARALAVAAQIEIEACSFERAGLFLSAAMGEPGAALAPIRSRLEHLLALVHESTGDRTGALAHYRLSIVLAERVRGAIRAERLRTSFLESSRDVYLDACRAALDEGGDASVAWAFEILELMRARTLMESCAGAAPRADNERGDGNPQNHCVEELNSLYSRLGSGLRSPEGEEPGLREHVALLEAKLERLADRESSEGEAGSPSERPLTLERARSMLAADAAVVTYFREGEHLSAMFVRREGTWTVRRIAPLDAVWAIRRRIEFGVDRMLELGARSTDSLLAPLRRLYSLLIAPLESYSIGVVRMHLVLSAELHALPLLAASATSSTRTCSLAPSTSIGVHLARAAGAGTPTGLPLIVGVDDADAPEMSREAHEIAERVPGAHLLSGREATADRFLEALPHASLVHLSAHGVHDTEFPMSSRVRLHDRWVTAREITGRLRRGSLAVLAGCDTARTAEWSGEDRFGLIRAFLASGSSAVVASLWRLPDSPARQFFVEFFERITRAGGSPALAAPACLSAILRESAMNQLPAAHWAGVLCKGAVL